MSVEAMRAVAWAQATLRADTTFMTAVPGGLWLGAAPAGTTVAPAAAVALASAPDLNTFNGNRIFSSALVDVKVSAPITQTAAVMSAIDRADTLLQRQRGSSQGGTVLGAVRESVVAVPEPQLIGDQQWFSVVASYRMPTTVP